MMAPLNPNRGYSRYPGLAWDKFFVVQAGPGKKLLENLEGCISTTRELGLAITRVAIDVSINYTLTKLLVPKMHIF